METLVGKDFSEILSKAVLVTASEQAENISNIIGDENLRSLSLIVMSIMTLFTKKEIIAIQNGIAIGIILMQKLQEKREIKELERLCQF